MGRHMQASVHAFNVNVSLYVLQLCCVLEGLDSYCPPSLLPLTLSCYLSLRYEGKQLVETYHLGLDVPWSLIFRIFSGCESLFPSAAGGNFYDDGWRKAFSSVFSIM